MTGLKSSRSRDHPISGRTPNRRPSGNAQEGQKSTVTEPPPGSSAATSGCSPAPDAPVRPHARTPGPRTGSRSRRSWRPGRRGSRHRIASPRRPAPMTSQSRRSFHYDRRPRHLPRRQARHQTTTATNPRSTPPLELTSSWRKAILFFKLGALAARYPSGYPKAAEYVMQVVWESGPRRGAADHAGSKIGRLRKHGLRTN